jgi:magnesium transporter
VTQLGPGAPAREHDPVVGCAVYRDGRRVEGGHDVDAAVDLARRSGGFVWVGLHEPDAAALAEVAQRFDLHPLAVEDAVHAHQRPKLEAYGDGLLFLVLKTVGYCPHDTLTANSDLVDVGEVMVFIGRDFVVTVRHGSHSGLSAVRARLEAQPHLLHNGPSAVLHAVADLVVDHYIEVTAALEEDILVLEASVFSPRRDRSDVERAYLVKREVLQLKRAVTPLAVPLRVLVDRPHPLVHEQVREYLRDVDDHLSRVREQIAGYDELLASILQASFAQLTIAENQDMRKLAAWAAIIAVPTAVAGIYGMNFVHMPELEWRYGYPMVLLVIVTACTLLYRGFKRNGWL